MMDEQDEVNSQSDLDEDLTEKNSGGMPSRKMGMMEDQMDSPEKSSAEEPEEDAAVQPSGDRLSSRQYIFLSALLVGLTLVTVLLIFFLRGNGRKLDDEPALMTTPTPTWTESPETPAPEGTPFPSSEFGSVDGTVYHARDDVFQMNIPAGWRLITYENTAKIVPRDYPEDPDNITVVISAKDPNFETHERTTFENTYALLYQEFQLQEFEKVTVGEAPAIRMVYTIRHDGKKKKQYQYVIDGDQTYTLTFTEVNWKMADHIESCIASFQLKERP